MTSKKTDNANPAPTKAAERQATKSDDADQSIFDEETAPVSSYARTPLKEYRAGHLRGSLWDNQGTSARTGEAYRFKTLSVTRSYQKDGEWKQDKMSLREREIPRLLMILSSAYHDLLFDKEDRPNAKNAEKEIDLDDEDIFPENSS